MNRAIAALLVLWIAPVLAAAAELHGPMHGFFWMSGSTERQGEEGLLRDMEETLAKNDLLSGVCLGASWAELEPEPGKFVWTVPDAEVALARKYHRQYKFILHLGVTTPPWVYQQGVASFASVISNPHRPNHGEKALIPLPWDPTYLRLLERLLREVAQRYGDDPAFVAICLSGANFMSAEMHLPKGPEDLKAWEQYGDFRARIEVVYQQLIDLYAGLFPHEQICLHISMPLPGMDDQVNAIVAYGVAKYPAQFTIQSCQLSGRNDNAALFSYTVVRKFQEAIHHGFQDLAGFAGEGSRQGSMEMTALNFIHTQGEYWELWRGDGASREICAKLQAHWDEAKKLGYDAYRQKLEREEKYVQSRPE